jgi:hypothetical protein
MPEQIDRLVCAEIPDPVTNPRLYQIITKAMIHGPCRKDLCGDKNGNCKKGFPKPFSDETIVVHDQYPTYRRRYRPQMIGKKKINNDYVVPYNAYLSLKYQAHVNVEVTTHMTASIKYLYAYIYEGYDVANLTVSKAGRLMMNEVDLYVSGRYVGAPEAIWRIYENKMHDRSHGVTRLPLHFENPVEVTFDEGLDIVPEQEAHTAVTMLEAFFTLNSVDQFANNIPYAEIVRHYVYHTPHRRWERRTKGADRIIGRIHDAHPGNKERFALRMLLLNTVGATSFENLRTVNGKIYDTYLEAAQALNLIRDDEVFINTFKDIATMHLYQ